MYVNPRPSDDEISEANKVGVHRGEDGELDVRARYQASKKDFYAAIIKEMFAAEWSDNRPIDWLDVGAGYGEVVAAVQTAAPKGSFVCGLEPMLPKVKVAQKIGLPVTNDTLGEIDRKFDVVSLINVYSHIPDFLRFGAELVDKIRPGGVLFLETGNVADLAKREEFPDKLYLPDHLVFGGPSQLRLTFDKLGLTLECYEEKPIDNWLWCMKSTVKNALRGRVSLPIPGQSKFRTVFYKARKR